VVEKKIRTKFSQSPGRRKASSERKSIPFGELAGKIARISPGQKVTYLTDLLEVRETSSRQ